MASTYEDTVLNFDLDFLHQTSKNTVQSKLDKQHKAILIAKQKTIATDSLIRKYYHKNELLEHTQKTLFDSKEECKQICIDYQNALEKCSKLENDIQILENKNNELDQKFRHSEDQCNAIKSHANQLQVLVKQHETHIEALKIESQLDKSNIKNSEKKLAYLEKENNCLHKYFSIFKDVLLGKKKLSKRRKDLLHNYEKYSKEDHNFFDDLSEEESSDNEIYDNLMSPHEIEDDLGSPEEAPSSSTITPTGDELSTGKNCKSVYKNDDTDRCSDYSNEVPSADTGRGSSLAFSDSEKCFNSPEYCSIDNPIKCIINKPTKILVNVATSPIPLEELGYRTTTPVALSNNIFDTRETVDKGLSPIKFTTQGARNLITPSKYNSIDVSLNNKTYGNEHDDEHMIQQQECLEINSSNNFNDDDTRDCEIESIFNEMRFNYKLITPIPKTPAKCYDRETQHISCASQTDHGRGIICHEAEKVREENKILHSNITDLAKEIMKIKCLLKSHPTLPVVENRDMENGFLKVNENNSNTYKVNEDHSNIKEINKVHSNIKEINEVHSNTYEEYVVVIESESPTSNICASLKDGKETLSDLQNQVDMAEENRDSCVITEDSVMESHNTTLSKLQFEDPVATFGDDDTGDIHLDNRSEHNSEDTFDALINNNNGSVEVSPCDESHKKMARARKLTNLDKLRRKMLPKSKIRMELRPPIKSRFKSKRLIHYKNIRKNNLSILANKRKSNINDSSLTLNDKTVYENAVKVMSELKSKQPDKFTSGITQKAIQKVSKCVKQKDDEMDDNNINQKTIQAENNCDFQKVSKCMKEKSNEIDINDINQKVFPTENKNCDLHKVSKCTKQKSNEADNNNSPRSLDRTTRSRSKYARHSQIVKPNLIKDRERNSIDSKTNYEIFEVLSQERRKRLKRLSVDKSDFACKRILRSSSQRQFGMDNKTSASNESHKEINTELPDIISEVEKRRHLDKSKVTESNKLVNYEDLELFTEASSEVQTPQTKSVSQTESDSTSHPKNSILCLMINKYSVSVTKYQPKKVSDSVTNLIWKMIETSTAEIINLPSIEAKNAMNKLVDELQSFDVKEFLAGFMKYMQDSQRKIELFSKVNTPPAPPMTKQEQVLLYIISQLSSAWPSMNIVNCILNNLEYLLFKLNRTPEFDVIESTSHFYAILCRYFQLKTRLRVFIIDALYCMQYKAIALIKQCLDVWMHILPLAHMGIAKSPLVTCLVYVLHFYKCEDAFNRVRDIRFILNRKYSYQMVEWNETKILEMFKNAIKDLRDNSAEKKILRLSLLIIAKRQGPRWCQKHVITNILQPIIEMDGPERIKRFCVAMLGPLMKPYPLDMKVHCEIVMNQLLDMLNQNPSPLMQEAIYTSLIYMSKHNQNRVIHAMLQWFPKSVSPECEEVLRDFVRDKSAKIWKTVLSKISLISDDQYNISTF